MKLLLVSMVLVFANSAFAADCFNGNQVRSWKAVDRSTLEVKTRKETFTVNTFICPQLDWGLKIGFRTFSSFRVCRGDEVIVLDAWNRVLDICRIKNITKN
jgi:hypothetical protein